MRECMSVAHRPIMTTLLLTSGTYFHGAVVALNVLKWPRAWLWVVVCMLLRSALLLVAPGEVLSMCGSTPVGHRTIVTTFQPGLGTFFDPLAITVMHNGGTTPPPSGGCLINTLLCRCL